MLTNQTLHALRSSLWEADQALRHVKDASISHFTVSRFILLYASMLTTMQIPTGLAFLVNNGALGLTQTMLRLIDPVTMEEDAVIDIKEGSNASSTESTAGKDQTQPTTPRAVSPQPTTTATMEEPLAGAALVRRISVGVRVVRGPDWKWGDQVLVHNGNICCRF